MSKERISLFEDEKYYERAKAIVAEMLRPSVCTIQRALNMGYGRAARLVDALKARGDWPPFRLKRD